MRQFAIIFVAIAAAVNSASAGFTFLGPTPYLSRADSPFPVDGSNPNFFLEDFEDGELNTPGIFQPLHPATHGSVIHPHHLTNSVDSDDGLIDGDGTGGHSMAANAYVVFPTDPPHSWSDLRFGFDSTELGFHPNAFGFVWTDGIAPNKVRIEVFGGDWQLLGQGEFQGLGGALPGDTSDDRFLGVVSSAPFEFVQITSMYPGSPDTFQIDHVQYGLIAVPEPSTTAMGIASLSLLLCRFFFYVQRLPGERRRRIPSTL